MFLACTYKFCSIQQDTIVALEALTEYSFETHVRDITSMKVSVESSANAGDIHLLNISNNNLAMSRRVDVSMLYILKTI